MAPSELPSTVRLVRTVVAACQAASMLPSITGAAGAAATSSVDRSSRKVSVPVAPGEFHAPTTVSPERTLTSSCAESPATTPLCGSWIAARQPSAWSKTATGTSALPSAPTRTVVSPYCTSTASEESSATVTSRVRWSAVQRGMKLPASPVSRCAGRLRQASESAACASGTSPPKALAAACSGGSSSESTAPK